VGEGERGSLRRRGMETGKRGKGQQGVQRLREGVGREGRGEGGEGKVVRGVWGEEGGDERWRAGGRGEVSMRG
jgi:hypothetical protein